MTEVQRGKPKLRQGVVVSNKMAKTVVVQVERLVRHPKYGKFVRQRTICYVHDENNESHLGDTVEKIGPKKYKITNGGFSTCMQPTPRWDLHAGTVLLNVDHYTLLTNAVLEVKGVPMLYLPILYYPTKREDRATGFLIPTYGASSLRGQTFHNAFFWAINRSQDATLMHDWSSKTGQGGGAEYRYNIGSGDGNIRAYVDDRQANVIEP